MTASRPNSGRVLKGRGTLVHYDHELDLTQIKRRATFISEEAFADSKASRVCYVLGMGAHPRSSYEAISKINGVEVVWNDTVLPTKWRWLRNLIASEAGLVKIRESSALAGVFERLSHLSMSAIYIFNAAYEKSFVQCVINNPVPTDYSFGLSETDDYFIYMVDADNSESTTGAYEIVSYGAKAGIRVDDLPK